MQRIETSKLVLFRRTLLNLGFIVASLLFFDAGRNTVGLAALWPYLISVFFGFVGITNILRDLYYSRAVVEFQYGSVCCYPPLGSPIKLCWAEVTSITTYLHGAWWHPLWMTVTFVWNGLFIKTPLPLMSRSQQDSFWAEIDRLAKQYNFSTQRIYK